METICHPCIQTFTVDDDVATSTPIAYHDFRGGMIHVSASQPDATLTFYASVAEDGTYGPIEAHNGAVTLSVTVNAGDVKEMPPQCFGVHWLKIVASDVSGSPITDYQIALKG